MPIAHYRLTPQHSGEKRGSVMSGEMQNICMQETDPGLEMRKWMQRETEAADGWKERERFRDLRENVKTKRDD